ncbi:MAG: transposase [Candidatus Vogelbacteria bacterium]|nr:transposase [Candidatus Vogelbacteria bacterium]
MSRKISFAPDEWYHLYNRGNDKRIIFHTDKDRDRFVKLLYLCNGQNPFHFFYLKPGEEYEFDRGELLVDIAGYCLMDNHFHILAKERKENGISAFMHRVATSYTMYFNKIKERKGRLFESNFQAKHIDSEEYLAYVHTYIHLNPVKMVKADWKESGLADLVKTEDFLKNYHYSSLHDWLDQERIENKIINKESLSVFESKKEVVDYLHDWLSYSNEAKPRC